MASILCFILFFFSSRRRHTRCSRDWSSDVCSSDLRAPPPEAGLRAAELEVEAADLELLQRVRRPLHVLLEPVVLVRLNHRNPRKVLEGDLGHLPVRVGAELLVDREAGGVAELVELRMTPVVLRATGTEQAPHHAVGVAQR